MKIIVGYMDKSQKYDIIKNQENGPSTLSQLHVEGWNCVYFSLFWSVNI